MPDSDAIPDLTEDAVLGGAIRLRQPARGYRLTSDAVLLAALTPVQPGQKVLELGTGYGQVALCLLAREPSLWITGLEIMPVAALLARENASLNHLADRLTVIEGDVASCRLSGFSVVVANPPYRQAAGHTASADPVKKAATVEQTPLSCWCVAAAQALLPGGQAVFIHDARRRADLQVALESAGLTDICILPLRSKAGGEVRRCVVRARAGHVASRVLPDLLLHEADGAWRQDVESVLRAPRSLNVWPD